jgi:hypothetical protein
VVAVEPAPGSYERIETGWIMYPLAQKLGNSVIALGQLA